MVAQSAGLPSSSLSLLATAENVGSIMELMVGSARAVHMCKDCSQHYGVVSMHLGTLAQLQATPWEDVRVAGGLCCQFMLLTIHACQVYGWILTILTLWLRKDERIPPFCSYFQVMLSLVSSAHFKSHFVIFHNFK